MTEAATGDDGDVYTGGDSLPFSGVPRWFGPPTAEDLGLGPGERLVAAVPGNVLQNGWRGVGGKLFVTTERVAFRPHRFDAILLGRSVMVPLADVASVETLRESLDLRTALRRPLAAALGVLGADRLRVETADGEVREFVVGDPSALVDRIEALR